MEMTKVLFNNNEDALEKLKEINLLSKTKNINDLQKIIYKKVDENDCIISFPCEVLGYNHKTTTFNTLYENLIIKVEDKIFNINIDYLIDMQKSTWNIKINNITTEKNHQVAASNNELLLSSKDSNMLIIHLYTGPRKGVILKIRNAKLTTPEDFLSTSITNGFNRAMKSNLTYEEIKQKHYVNKYNKINFHDDNETFDLEDNMTTFSLNHKKSNYVFIEENLSVAEIDSKKYNRIVSIDFETANSKRASVCSIGFVVEELGEIIEEQELLVNPQTDFTPMSMRIHGISPLDVVNSPTWDIAWKEVEKHITDSTLVIAHNLRSMELACIRQECERYNMELPTFAKTKGHNKMAYDTLKIAKETQPEFKNHKLDTLAKHFNIELDHHNALSDAKACLELFHHLKGDYATNI